MKLQEVLSRVEAALKRAWPDIPVYQDLKPKGFERPSFLLEGGPITITEKGGGQAKHVVQVRVTAFTPVDAYGNSETEELRETADSLLELFEGGYILLGDRAPHVAELTGDYGFDYAEVTAKLSYHEVRQRGSHPAGSPAGSSIMENFQTIFK